MQFLRYLCPVVIVICFAACSRDNSPTSSQQPVVPKKIVYYGFESDSDLACWNLGSHYGHTTLDTVVKFKGARSVHLSPDSGCYVIDHKTGISVEAGKRYSVSFYAIVQETKIGETCYCVGDFMVSVQQGNASLLNEGVFDTPDWELKTFYFIPANNLPVNIMLYVGNDVWLDDLSLVQELDP